MIVIVLTKDERTIDLLREAMSAKESQGKVEVFETDEKLLERLQDQDKSSPTAVFVDLDGFPDGARHAPLPEGVCYCRRDIVVLGWQDMRGRFKELDM